MAPVVICIFAKPPVPGAVKTRLARALGPQRAAELAHAFLENTIAALKALPWAQSILSSPEPVCSELPVLMQRGGDLGARIERVPCNALQLAPFAIAIGADAPALPRRLLEAARACAGWAGSPSCLRACACRGRASSRIRSATRCSSMPSRSSTVSAFQQRVSRASTPT